MRYPMLSAVFVLVSGVVQGCSPTDAVVPLESSTETTTLSRDFRLSNGVLLPAGTIVWDGRDRTDREFLHFRLPTGYKLLVRGDAGEVLSAVAEGGITCSCKDGEGEGEGANLTEGDGKGCSPFHASGGGEEVVGCAMNGCKSCLGEVTATARDADGGIILRTGGAEILHVAGGVSLVSDLDELRSLTCPTQVALSWPEFTHGVRSFLDGVQSGGRASVLRAESRSELPAGYEMAFVNAYGKVLRVPVATQLLRDRQARNSEFAALFAMEEAPVEEDGEGSCSCLSGGSGCSYEKKSVPLIGYAEWCEAEGCQSCSLSFESAE